MYMPRKMMFSRPVASGLRPTETSSRAETFPGRMELSTSGRINPSENPQQGRLAGAIGADQAETIAILDIECQVI